MTHLFANWHNWAASDALRAQVDALGWMIKDTKEGFDLVKK